MLIPLVLVAGAAGGAVWAAIAGFFKAYFNVNEILSTIMLNLVAVQVMNYLLSGPMIDKSQSFAVTGLDTPDQAAVRSTPGCRPS